MTVNDVIMNNTDLFQRFSQWLSTIQYQAFNREAGSAVIVPGYRAIVNWVKDRMSQEIYARIRQIMAGGAAAYGAA
jgi:hypothetical protein